MKAVDLFAGAGGFTTGARNAGVDVLWAANHWLAAVNIHQLNHPDTQHACQDLHQADWSQVPAHDLLLASPACQGHSFARGRDRAHHDKSRSTAWAVVSCAEYHRPSVVLVENLEGFRSKWALFPAWNMAMKSLGYAVSPHLIDAANHGVPQHRKRLFIVCTQSVNPIKLALPNREHRPVSAVIEWDNYRWSAVNKPGRSQATLARVKRGRRELGEQFCMPYYGSGSGMTGRSLDRPLGTVTTRDRWAIVDGNRMRMFQPAEYRACMGFPSSYQLPKARAEAIFMLGNAVAPPVATDLILALKQTA